MAGTEQHPQIKVYAKNHQVGSLIFEQPRFCQLRYSQHWLETGYAISPHLPLSGQFNSQTTENFIRNLFPEGAAFDTLLATENLSKNNLYAILKAIGQDTTGALTFAENAGNTATTLRLVTEDELMQRLDNSTNLTLWDGKFRLSVAGVQNKLNIYLGDNDAMCLADGTYASTHIIKFASEKFPSIVINELYCMKLAAAAGISVAPVRHKKLGKHSALLVKRFDRRIKAAGVDKHHIIDGCQALDLPPEFKYEQQFGYTADVAHLRDGASLKKLFSFANRCAIPAVATQKIIDWMLFNLIIGNSDAHGKNISFFIGKSGLTITPCYDLVSVVFEATQQHKLDTQLAMAIGDNFDIHNITAFDLLSLADDAGIKFDVLKRRLERLATVCRNLSQRLDFSDEGLSKQQLVITKALAQLVDSRCDALLEQSRQFKAVILSAFS